MQPPPGEHMQPRESQVLQQRLAAGQPISPRILTPDHVRMLQQALNDNGTMKISVDGQWGPQSESGC